MHEWITLTKVFGDSLRNPTTAQMEDALDELFDHADADHPDSWIECGSESGPLCCISIFSNGYALYTKYSDADMSEVLETKRLSPIDRDAALALWSNLIQGRTP
ncbi:hypothetical protein [Duganella sp. Root1480D1]|uniref:hypothetical protein n=1 Tax=Duganella sp. Root1480D1 TaxID=1736471 RepID=UPI000710B3ED|nr:hypothetical protein [Duganella sp. Root1480D1]KQZ30489.1 hypothetical protein ASD58_10800 [Duganella sp. Root1480D1]